MMTMLLATPQLEINVGNGWFENGLHCATRETGSQIELRS